MSPTAPEADLVHNGAASYLEAARFPERAARAAANAPQDDRRPGPALGTAGRPVDPAPPRAGIPNALTRIEEALTRLAHTIDGELESAIAHIDAVVTPFLRPGEPNIAMIEPRDVAGDTSETSDLGRYLVTLAESLEGKTEALTVASARIHRLALRVDH